MTDCEAGDEVNVKSGTAMTTSVAVAVWTRVPLVPVMVSVNDPPGVVAAVVTVSVEVPAVVTDVGLNVAVAPAGNPLTVRATAPVKPFTAADVGVYVVPAPCATVCVAGDAVNVKSGGALTSKVMSAVWTRLPLVAVTVTV